MVSSSGLLKLHFFQFKCCVKLWIAKDQEVKEEIIGHEVRRQRKETLIHSLALSLNQLLIDTTTENAMIGAHSTELLLKTLGVAHLLYSHLC